MRQRFLPCTYLQIPHFSQWNGFFSTEVKCLQIAQKYADILELHPRHVWLSSSIFIVFKMQVKKKTQLYLQYLGNNIYWHNYCGETIVYCCTKGEALKKKCQAKISHLACLMSMYYTQMSLNINSI